MRLHGQGARWGAPGGPRPARGGRGSGRREHRAAHPARLAV